MQRRDANRTVVGGEDSVRSITFCFLFARVIGRSRIWRDAMKNFATKVNRFLKSEDGPTAVEYAVMLALIIVVCLGAITSIGSSASGTFSSVAGQL